MSLYLDIVKDVIVEYEYKNEYKNKINHIRWCVKAIILLYFLYVVTSMLRWGSSNENLLYLSISKFIGYTIANYNRVVLMISGELNYVNYDIPKIFWLFPVFKIPLTNIVFLNHRNTYLLTHLVVKDAGLNSSPNMVTLFGGIYEAISLEAFIYFAILGIIGNKLFISFKKKKIFGIIFYPLFYASVAL